MNNNHQYQLGIFSWSGYVMPLPERLQLIKNAGFDATSLWWEDEIGSPEIKKEHMPQMVRDSGLFLDNIHIPYHQCDDLWSKNQSVRNAVINQYRTWISDCAEFNIPVMVMHITDALDLPSPDKHSLDSICQLLKTAEEANVIIALENTGREDYIRLVLSEIDSPYLGFCYDSSHNRIYSQGDLSLLQELGHRLVTTHLADNDGQRDCHWLPGEGIVNWKRLCQVFPAQYHRYITLEVVPTEQERRGTPQNFLSRAYQSAAWVSHLCSQ